MPRGFAAPPATRGHRSPYILSLSERTRPSARSRRGFTFVELLVVIGIVMLVIGLAMPALSGVISRARMTRDMVLVRQHAANLIMYCSDYAGVFPLTHEIPEIAAQTWYEAMMVAGFYDSIAEVDPQAVQPRHHVSYRMSKCMVRDWREMRPGHTIPTEDAVSTPVHMADIWFPSIKGMVYRAFNGILWPREGGMYFCCTDSWEAPIALADGSTISAAYDDFEAGRPLRVVDGIGQPVDTTWFGVHGVDR